MCCRRKRCLSASALFLLCSLTTACTDPSGDPPALLRLVALLPDAEIESPLTRLPAASSIAELGPVALEERWSESFESPQLHFSLEGGCTRELDDGRGSLVLACRDEGQGRAVLSVQPGTGYRVRLQGRRERPWGYTVTVQEHAEDTTLRIFRFPDLSERWAPHEIWLFSAASTRTLEIRIEPQHAKGRLWLDEIVVEQVELTIEQELRLLKAWHPRTAKDSDLGIAKRGRLLPIDDPEDVASALEGNYVVRDALLAPPPTDIHFPLQVPRAARLRLSYALAEQSSPEDVVRFRVLANERRGTPRVLLEESLSLGPDGGRRWQDRQISLAHLEGRDVRLTLETRTLAGNGRAYPLWGSPEIYTPRRPGEPPNVILIAVDTLRADRLSCYGHTPGVSPAIDALAADGVRFEQAISSANWTAPAFFSLFTGRAVPDLPESLEGASEVTLAEHFQNAGYSTGAILYKSMLYDQGFDRGFDSFFNAPRLNVRAEHNLTRALGWLQDNGTRRFFLFLHFNDPHQPFCQPQETVGEESLRQLQGFGLRLPIMVHARDATTVDPRHPRRLEPRQPCHDCRQADTLVPSFKNLARALYDDAIRYTDDNIGQLLSALKEEGLYDNAVIAFVSDHGETLWSHGEHYAHMRDNLHDELIRVPLIIKPPRSRGWPTGWAVKEQVRLLDLMPTLLELAGIDPPPSAAKSLMPALEPQATPSLRDRPAFSIDRKANTLSLRHKGWKYIRYYPKIPPDQLREALYDLSADPGETMNLVKEEQRTLERLRLAMDEQLLAHGSGRLVVVKADPGSKYRIRLRWDREARVGLFPQPGLKLAGTVEEAAWEVSALASRSLAFLTSFLTSPEAGLEIVIQVGDEPEHRKRIGPEQMLPYRAGLLADLLSQPGIQARVFAGRDRMLHKAASPGPVDAQQLEALKALGYIQ